MAETAIDTEKERSQERLLGAAEGAFVTFASYLRDQLGYYAAPADAGPLTPPVLAKRTEIEEPSLASR